MAEKKDIIDQIKEEVRKELREKKEGVKTSRPEKPPQQEIPFNNATNLKFINISHEAMRQYLYPNGANITIKLPLKLSIDRTSIHRVFDSTGLSYFIPPTWIAVVTKPKPGGPDFIM